eukprot:3320151-Rhodomonas_salina.1
MGDFACARRPRQDQMARRQHAGRVAPVLLGARHQRLQLSHDLVDVLDVVEPFELLTQVGVSVGGEVRGAEHSVVWHHSFHRHPAQPGFPLLPHRLAQPPGLAHLGRIEQ